MIIAKKQYFLTIDTETTQPKHGNENTPGIPAKVADFGAVVSDRKGTILTQCATLVHGVYDNPDTPLFFTSSAEGIWSKAGQDFRYTKYNDMLEKGIRMLATVNAINRWLEKVAATYSPFLTAYNLSFDIDKCQNTSIDLTLFPKRFCLWHASQQKWGKTKKYRQFVLDTHGFNSPTDLGNMSYKTNAEIMARFVLGLPNLENEPHTALEDIIGYELPILNKLLKTVKTSELLTAKPYHWQDYQVKDWFKPA